MYFSISTADQTFEGLTSKMEEEFFGSVLTQTKSVIRQFNDLSTNNGHMRILKLTPQIGFVHTLRFFKSWTQEKISIDWPFLQNLTRSEDDLNKMFLFKKLDIPICFQDFVIPFAWPTWSLLGLTLLLLGLTFKMICQQTGIGAAIGMTLAPLVCQGSFPP